jgi:acyl-CoA synthetase (AMP-forming)/AMP-acid ligase II
MRIRVGRFIALAYLFCVLAPAASLAWGSGPAPCLDDALLADRAPQWWIPNDMQIIEEVPKTSVGKFSKKTLREQFAKETAA